jgi:hypothetical protein
MIKIGPMVKAAAKGILPDVPIYVSTAFPMKKLELPNKDGTIKSPRESEKVKIDPATTPGKGKGRITLRKVCGGFAPGSPEASTNDFAKPPSN